MTPPNQESGKEITAPFKHRLWDGFLSLMVLMLTFGALIAYVLGWERGVEYFSIKVDKISEWAD